MVYCSSAVRKTVDYSEKFLNAQYITGNLGQSTLRFAVIHKVRLCMNSRESAPVPEKPPACMNHLQQISSDIETCTTLLVILTPFGLYITFIKSRTGLVCQHFHSNICPYCLVRVNLFNFHSGLLAGSICYNCSFFFLINFIPCTINVPVFCYYAQCCSRNSTLLMGPSLQWRCIARYVIRVVTVLHGILTDSTYNY